MTTHTRPNFAASPLAQSDAAAKAQPAQPPATLAALVIDTAVRLGITHWVISPGSRSAPLTAALAQRTDISPLVVYDERSAGYIALGLAQQLRLPVGLVCTSGTAALNYGPAIAEAFYQSLPLVAITADRPPEWIDQQDNQAIHQMGIYGAHVRASFNLPVNDDHPDTHWHALRTVVDALQAATSLPPGPVHINAPLREPLYTTPPQRIIRPPHVAQAAQVHTVLAEQEVQGLLVALQTAARILIAGGPHPPDAPLIAALTALGNDSRVAVIGDVTANLHTVPSMHRHWEAALGTRDNATLDALQPELVISFGGAVTSRGLKTLLRNRPPSAFWRVGPGMPAPDTYKANTRVLPVTPANFFTSLAAAVKDRSASTAGYQQSWRNLADKAASTLDAELDSQPFGEFAAMRTLLRHLPQGAMRICSASMHPTCRAASLPIAEPAALTGASAPLWAQPLPTQRCSRCCLWVIWPSSMIAMGCGTATCLPICALFCSTTTAGASLT
jgi:2-succinyl-5-enolpyruvyl-6-hydroxy-3-cyclohexene-1-carboxylate synthase